MSSDSKPAVIKVNFDADYDLDFDQLIRIRRKKETSDSKHSGIENTIAYSILVLSAIIAFVSRLYSVINYESIIHEFDPWFNYRCTKYFVENGLFKFFHWFDEQAWYPHGRHVGYTVYPGLMLTSGLIYKVLHIFSLPIHIRDVCVFLSPIFSSFTVYAMYSLTKEIWNRRAALLAAFFIAIAPGYISRSVAGSYDNEGVAIFALVFTFYLWLKAVKNSSVLWSLLAALSYFYMVAAWGGYVFIINIIPLHVIVNIVIEGYSDKIYSVYSSFFVMAVILAMQVPFVSVHVVIKSSEHLASIGMFGLLQILAARHHSIRIITTKLCSTVDTRTTNCIQSSSKGFIKSQGKKLAQNTNAENVTITDTKKKTTNVKTTLKDKNTNDESTNNLKEFDFITSHTYSKDELIYVLERLFLGVIGVCLFSLLILEMAGVVMPWSGRFYSMFDTGYAKIHIPIIASVAEHQPTTWSSYINDLHFLPIAMIFGINLCVSYYNSARGFAIIYAIFASYFSGVMIRLILTLTPIACVMASIAVSFTLENLLKLEFLSEIHENITNTRVSKSSKDILAIKKSKTGSSLTCILSAKFVSLVGIIMFMALLLHFMIHCGFVNQTNYSSPSVILSSNDQFGQKTIIDDFREAYYWLDRNTEPDAKIASWWDYGYQIAGFSNRTTIVDNNTNNNRHIATVGKIMASDEKTAYPIIQDLEVDYLLVIFGGVIGFSGDDINKFLWMVRIAQGEFPEDVIENEFFSTNGAYTIGKELSPRMRESLMYKMSYYNFDKIRVSYHQGVGFDNVRKEVIGHMGFKLETLEEAFTSSNWIVRIYKFNS